MKFYQDDKPGLIWNPARDRLAAEFLNGVCEADGESANILMGAGYRYDKPEPVTTPAPEPVVVPETTPEPVIEPKPKRTVRRKKK